MKRKRAVAGKMMQGETIVHGGAAALLDTLREIPAGQVYTAAEKRHVLAGLGLCMGKAVRDITWSRDRSSLVVEVFDTTHHEVAFAVDAGHLRIRCDCREWRPFGGCPHAVCALATLKKVLAPASLGSLHLDERHLDEMRNRLGAGTAAASAQGETVPAPLPATRLVVERRESGISVRVWRGDHPLTLADRDLTARLRDYLRETARAGGSEVAVEEFHARFGEIYPIVFRQAGEEVPLAFDPDLHHSTRAVFDLAGDTVTVFKSLEDGAPLSPESFASWRYFFDIPGRRIGRVGDPEGWRLWGEVNVGVARRLYEEGVEVERNNRSLALSREAFNDIYLAFPAAGPDDFLAFTRFTVNGEVTPPALTEPRYRLNVTAEGGDRFRLTVRGVADGAPFMIPPNPFWFFCGEERWRASAPLRTKKRSAAVMEACFASLGCATKTELNRMLRERLANGDFEKRAVRTEAKRIISEFALFCGVSVRLVIAGESGWCLVPQEIGRQARLLEIPYRLFGPDVFAESESPGEMFVDRDEFVADLPALHAQLQEAGFDLLFEDRPLQAVSLDVTLDATRSTLDWFELRPEIRCGAEALDEREIAEALAGGGIFRRGDELLVLDEESSRILALLYPETGKKKRKKGEVVRIPRLQILDWLLLRRHGVTVRLSPEDERIFASLTSFEEIPPAPLPEGLRGALRPYQEDAFHWLAFLYRHRFGACLADDMGLGKTIQAISLLAALHEGRVPAVVEDRRPHLIVVPPSLLFNWENELNRFYPDFTVLTYRGTGRSTDFSGADIVLTSYGIIPRDIDKLREIPFHVIVFDEAQAVKNIQADTTGACRQLRGAFTLVLTGTPVENHLGEYYSVMDLAVPGLLGPYDDFRRRMASGGAPFLDTLIRRTRPFVLRRSKQMIAAELPPKIETDIHLELTPKQKALYTRTVEEVRETVAEAWCSKSAGQARIIALTAILRLRQLCLSPRLLVPDAKEGSPKVEFLVEQLGELFAEGHSVLVFSQFTSFLDIVQTELRRHGLRHQRLDGSTPVPERKKLVAAFQKEDEPSVFLLSLKAGGKGLNLTRATYVFHLDPWWNPAVENQASDRAHRIGQTRQVTITRLVMRHTIEEKMMELKQRKLKLYKALLDDSTAGEGSGISREDFEFLLG